MTRTKRTYKTKWYKQSQIYLNNTCNETFQNVSVLILFVRYSCKCVVWVCNKHWYYKKGLNNKSVLCALTKYFYCLFLLVVWWNFYVWGWKKSHRKSITRNWMVAESIHFCGSWLLEVKCKKRKSGLKSREWECSHWKSHWKECVDPVCENVKRSCVDSPSEILKKRLTVGRLEYL